MAVAVAEKNQANSENTEDEPAKENQHNTEEVEQQLAFSAVDTSSQEENPQPQSTETSSDSQ